MAGLLSLESVQQQLMPVKRRWARLLLLDRNGNRTVLGKACASAVSMASLFAFFFLLVTVFAVLAMMLFGRQLDFSEGRPRQNFDSFPRAWMTIF